MRRALARRRDAGTRNREPDPPTGPEGYGARARPGAPVSMPLAWEELGPGIGPAQFNVGSALARISHTDDPWADFRRAERPLPKR